MYTKTLREPVFRAILYFIWDATHTEASQYLWDKHRIKHDLNGMDGIYLYAEGTDKNGNSLGGEHFIWINGKDNYYTLTHECLHLVKGVCEALSIPFDKDNDELVAYYQEYWVRRLWRVVSKTLDKEATKPSQKSPK